MKCIFGTVIAVLLLNMSLSGQSRSELEDKRKKALEEISYVDNLLKETEKQKKTSLNELQMIGKKLNLRESVLSGLREEIGLISDRIELNTIAIDIMESDLNVLKNDYRKAVINSFKSSKGNPEIFYILSARDFNQGYKRLKYLQQITKFRRDESETIIDLKSEIEEARKNLEEDLDKVSELKTREELQKSLLQDEKDKQQKMVDNLGKREKQLQKELEEKKRIARKIEAEIEKIIDDERKKKVNKDVAPELKLISDNFYENKGLLPWPVEKGVITGHFGVQSNPLLKYVTEDNIDIEITCLGETPVRSVFKGEVARIFSIPGANMAVIIRHGKYLTVYQNLVNIRVKAGEKVETKQVIGNVFTDSENGNKAILKFMIFEEKVKLDPELWISKKK
jgi:murein hydrolase activator